MNDSEQVPASSPENREIVRALRERFATLAERLTPDVQPADMYLLDTGSSDSGRAEHSE
ncbi:MAG: hypothetical protein JOY62_14810 [Acidobacteriaceae bacterium]|nr:hypothetical protein [Acidobacteriaceae bacterium]